MAYIIGPETGRAFVSSGGLGRHDGASSVAAESRVLHSEEFILPPTTENGER